MAWYKGQDVEWRFVPGLGVCECRRIELDSNDKLEYPQFVDGGRNGSEYQALLQTRNAQLKAESERIERLDLGGLTISDWDRLHRDPLEMPDSSYDRPTTTQRLMKRIGG